MPEQPNHAVAQPKPNVLAQRAIKPPQKAAGQAKPAIAVAGLVPATSGAPRRKVAQQRAARGAWGVGVTFLAA